MNLTENEKLESKITAYALDELPEIEQKEWEEKVSTSESLQSEILQIQSLAKELSQISLEVNNLELTQEQRSKIVNTSTPVIHHRNPWMRWGTSLVALSACLITGFILLQKEESPSPLLAETKKSESKAASPIESHDSTADSATPSVPAEIPTEFPELASATTPDEIQESDVLMKRHLESSQNLTTLNPSSSTSSETLETSSETLPHSKTFAEKSEADSSTAIMGYIASSQVNNLSQQTVNKWSTRSRLNTPPGSFHLNSASSNESYNPLPENEFQNVKAQPLSTFSIDVDTASYSNIRRFLNQNQLPPKASVRIEEMINYFSYQYPQPQGEDPFSVTTEMTDCPWKPTNRLLRVGIKGREISSEKRPQANLVFLVDVSGSMQEPQKLPLVQQSLKLLVEQLKNQDRVALVTYAGSSGLALPSTSIENRNEILRAIDQLQTGGSTHGSMGIHLAYDIAKANFISDGINRVILCTDGDFNVGVTDPQDLVTLIQEKAKSNVFLSVYGFGMGNLKDSTLEKLADNGNGTYGYIDSFKEARREFVQRLSGNLQTIAKDVKIQIEFNPEWISEYRLIGYENRILNAQDFNNDKKDAGEIGSGHTVTALYEIVPQKNSLEKDSIDPLKYQSRSDTIEKKEVSQEWMTLKLRSKKPGSDKSTLKEVIIKNDSYQPWDETNRDTRFATTVAAFGMKLRGSSASQKLTLDEIASWAEKSSQGQQDRKEFLELIKTTKQLMQK